MKKYKDLYEEEKQRHEEALQRYHEDHIDEMEIVNLYKKCNKKARKVPRPKNASGSPKLDEPKKYQGPLMIQVKRNRSLEKHQTMEKNRKKG